MYKCRVNVVEDKGLSQVLQIKNEMESRGW